MGFLPSYGSVHTTVWMHHLGTYKIHREKAKWELYKNVTSDFEQILEVTLHKTTIVQPLKHHFKNHPRQTRHAGLFGEAKINS